MLAAWALHAWAMTTEFSFAIMLWSCHVATLAIAAGLLGGWLLPVAAGTVFHIGAGIPSWLVETLVSGRWFPTSVAVHTLPAAVGVLCFRRRGRLPRGTLTAAWSLDLGMVPVSRWTTAPEWNVNLAHETWKPLEPFFPSLFAFHVAAALATLASLGAVSGLLNRLLARRAARLP